MQVQSEQMVRFGGLVALPPTPRAIDSAYVHAPGLVQGRFSLSLRACAWKRILWSCEVVKYFVRASRPGHGHWLAPRVVNQGP